MLRDYGLRVHLSPEITINLKNLTFNNLNIKFHSSLEDILNRRLSPSPEIKALAIKKF